MLALGFRIRDLQSKVGHEWFKVAISMQQGVTVFDTPSRNDRINGSAHREPKDSQSSEILGRLYGNVESSKLNEQERIKCPPSLVEVAFRSETLKYFGHDQVSDQNSLFFEQ